MQRLMIAMSWFVASTVFAANVYQWKDANGNTVFSDKPSPSQKSELKRLQPNVVQTSGGSYTMREAVRKAPITLWTNNCGSNCDSARNLLNTRGTPYSLRNPEASKADYDAMMKLSGSAVVPLLQVGGTLLRGFDELSWNSALDAVGYPKTPDPTLRNAAPVLPTPFLHTSSTPTPNGNASATPPPTPAPTSTPTPTPTATPTPTPTPSPSPTPVPFAPMPLYHPPQAIRP